jgi:hypothetical protein
LLLTEDKLNQTNRSPNGFFTLEAHPQQRILCPLFLVSFASLYLEVLLIRWIGTEVRVFAYFQNLTLIACFLGFGLGCYHANAKKPFLFNGVTLGILVILVSLPIPRWKWFLEGMSSLLAFSRDAQIWSSVNPSLYASHSTLALSFASLLLIAGFLALLTATMIPLGQWVGTYLSAAKNPINAYSINLLGSLCGIWLFAGMSFLGLPPAVWVAVAFLLFILVRPRIRDWQPRIVGGVFSWPPLSVCLLTLARAKSIGLLIKNWKLSRSETSSISG